MHVDRCLGIEEQTNRQMWIDRWRYIDINTYAYGYANQNTYNDHLKRWSWGMFQVSRTWNIFISPVFYTSIAYYLKILMNYGTIIIYSV